MSSLESRVKYLELSRKYITNPTVKSLKDILLICLIYSIVCFSLMHIILTVGIGLADSPVGTGDNFYLWMGWLIDCTTYVVVGAFFIVPLLNIWSYFKFKKLMWGEDGE